MTQPDELLEELLRRYVSEHTYSFDGFKVLRVNSVGHELETPLHMACTRNELEDVMLLIQGGADVNAQTDIGTTPLMRAVYAKNTAMVDALIKAGADITIRDSYGSTALDIAKSAQNNALTEIVRLLSDPGQT
jgi:ankyrin repeat protein